MSNLAQIAPWLAGPVALGVHAAPSKYLAARVPLMIGDFFRRIALKPNGRGLIITPPRMSKPLANDTPVMTTLGWKRHGDIEIGDCVFAPDGLPVMVRGVGPMLIGEETYAVEFSDGETILAGAHHDWPILEDCALARCGFRRKGGRGARHRHARTRETHRLYRKVKSSGSRDHGSILTAPLQFPERDLPIDPYLLGVWLGDGMSTVGYITAGSQDVAQFATLGDKMTEVKPGIYRIHVDGLTKKLRLLRLNGNKHVPEEYFRSSVRQRLALIQGLMDTDGCCSKEGQMSFTNTNKLLSYGLIELLWSMGMKARMSEYRATLYGKDCGPVWELNFSPPPGFKAFRLERKNARSEAVTRCNYSHMRFIRSVKSVDSIAMRCITVDGGLYLAGKSLIATHNSFTCSHYGTAWKVLIAPEKNVMLMGYGSTFARRWGRLARETVKQHGPSVGVMMSNQVTAQGEWQTRQLGGMKTVGIVGDATGRGADLLVVDDPTRDARDALSRTKQDAAWDAWNATINTRLEPGGSAIVIGTRWSEIDLIGRLLAAFEEGPDAEGYEPWEILYLPAIADGKDYTGRRPHVDPLGREPGEALWPERFPIERLRAIEKRTPWWFAALYQGRPQPAEGGIFQAKYANYWRPAGAEYDHLDPPEVDGRICELVTLPPLDRQLQSWDCNNLGDVKELARGGERSDVSGQVWGHSRQRKFLLDRVLGLLDLRGTVAAIKHFERVYPEATSKVIEAKAQGPAVMAVLRHEPHKVQGLVPATPIGSKLERVIGSGATEGARAGRALSMADDWVAGNIYLPHPSLILDGRSFLWVQDFLHKLTQFPRAGTDDTDAASQAWTKLAMGDWVTTEREELADKAAEARTRRVAQLPKDAPLPKDMKELLAARARAAVEALERANMKRQANAGRRGRGAW